MKNTKHLKDLFFILINCSAARHSPASSLSGQLKLKTLNISP